MIGVADFGAVNLFIALTGPLALIMGLGLPEGIGRFYFRDQPFERVLASALTLIGAGAAVTAIALLTLREPIEQALGLPPLLISLAVVCAPAIVVRTAWLTVLRAERRSRAFAAARLAEPIVSLAIVLGLLALAGSLQLPGVLAAYLGGILLVALVGLARLASRARGGPSRPISRQLLAYSLPLVLHGLAGAGLASFDQIILNQILGLEPTGLYAYAYRISMVMYLVAFGIGSAWSPVVLGKLQDGGARGELRSLTGVLAAVIAAAGVALMVLLPPLARTIGGPEYRAAEALIPIVVCGYVWMALYVLATPFLVHLHRTVTLASYSATALAMNVGLNYLLIPRLGPLGAALTTLASYLLLFVLVWRRTARAFPELPVGRLVAAGLLSLPPALLVWWLLS